MSVSKRHSATTSPRGYHASGTWLDESAALLGASNALDRLDPGPIERPMSAGAMCEQLDEAALDAMAEALRAAFTPMHEALERLAEHWQREVVPSLAAMCEQLRALDVRKVDAARRRSSPVARTARGRPTDYPAPRR